MLSRAAVYVLQPLAEDDLKQIVARASAERSFPAIEKEAVERLVAYADGDARRLLNTLETLGVAAAREQLATLTRHCTGSCACSTAAPTRATWHVG